MQQSSVKKGLELNSCIYLPLETASGPLIKYVRPQTANFDHPTHPCT